MKIKGRGIVAFTAVVFFSTICANVLNFSIKQKDASAAAKIEATATASINVISGLKDGKIAARNNGIEYNIDITLTQRASEGDFVEYYIENLPTSIAEKDVYSQGVAIGKIEAISGTFNSKYST